MPIGQHTDGVLFLAKDSTHFFKNYIESQDESLFHFGDSTMLSQQSKVPTIVQRTSEGNFSGRMLQKESIQISPLSRSEKNNQLRDSFFLSYSISALIIMIALYWSFSKISMAVRGFFSARIASAYVRNYGNSADFPMGIINVGYFILFSIVLAKQVLLFQFIENQPLFYIALIILGGSAIILLYRFIVQQVAAYIFSTKEATKNIAWQASTSRVILAILFLILTPFVVYSPFTDYFIVFLTFIVISIYTIRLYKTIKTGISAGMYSIFYFILYFCTLEMVPLAILYKLVSMS